jgi:hypothetical protein
MPLLAGLGSSPQRTIRRRGFDCGAIQAIQTIQNSYLAKSEGNIVHVLLSSSPLEEAARMAGAAGEEAQLRIR